MVGKQYYRRVAIDTSSFLDYVHDDAPTIALMRAFVNHGVDVLLPSPVLAETFRGGSKDAPYHQAHKDFRDIDVPPRAGRAAGEMLGEAGASPALAMDALIIAAAQAAGAQKILTRDIGDHEQLAPGFTFPEDYRTR